MTSARRAFTPDWGTPTSFGVWGGSRGDRARLASVLAHRIDPDPFWLQVEDASVSPDVTEESVLGGLNADHVFRIGRSELAPETDLGNVAAWFLRKDAPGQDLVGHLADYIQLPRVARGFLEGRSRFSPPLALVIALSDRAEPRYSTREGGIRPFIEAFNECATTVIFTILSKPPPNGRDVDYVFRLSEEGPEDARVVQVRCEQGAPRDSPGLFSMGSRFDLHGLVDRIEGSSDRAPQEFTPQASGLRVSRW